MANQTKQDFEKLVFGEYEVFKNLPFKIVQAPFRKFCKYQRDGHWNEKERLKYTVFLGFFQKLLEDPELKKNARIYEMMSDMIITRNPSQCRSHHQKMEKYRSTINDIITSVTEKYEPRVYEEIKEKYTIFIKTLLENSDKYIRLPTSTEKRREKTKKNSTSRPKLDTRKVSSKNSRSVEEIEPELFEIEEKKGKEKEDKVRTNDCYEGEEDEEEPMRAEVHQEGLNQDLNFRENNQIMSVEFETRIKKENWEGHREERERIFVEDRSSQMEKPQDFKMPHSIQVKKETFFHPSASQIQPIKEDKVSLKRTSDYYEKRDEDQDEQEQIAAKPIYPGSDLPQKKDVVPTSDKYEGEDDDECEEEGEGQGSFSGQPISIPQVNYVDRLGTQGYPLQMIIPGAFQNMGFQSSQIQDLEMNLKRTEIEADHYLRCYQQSQITMLHLKNELERAKSGCILQPNPQNMQAMHNIQGIPNYQINQ